MSPKAAGQKGKKTGKLVVLSAPSGTGKSTLAKMLLDRHPRLRLSISYTTRAPRGAEKDGIQYFFAKEEDFHRMASAGDFLEYALVFGKYWYGTSRASVESLLDQGCSVLFDIDVQGAHSLKTAYGARCVTIFVLPPSLEELEVRLRNRKTDSAESIETRLATAREELKHAPEFDHRIVNKDLEGTVAEIERILRREKCI